MIFEDFFPSHFIRRLGSCAAVNSRSSVAHLNAAFHALKLAGLSSNFSRPVDMSSFFMRCLVNAANGSCCKWFILLLLWDMGKGCHRETLSIDQGSYAVYRGVMVMAEP